MFLLCARLRLEMNLFVKQTNEQTENFQLKNLSVKEAHQAAAQAINNFFSFYFGKWFVPFFFHHLLSIVCCPNVNSMRIGNYHKSTSVNLCQQNLMTFLFIGHCSSCYHFSLSMFAICHCVHSHRVCLCPCHPVSYIFIYGLHSMNDTYIS